MDSVLPSFRNSSLHDYIRIARIDHWFKNIFMLPGAALALMFTGTKLYDRLLPLLVGILSTCLVASANYVVNEWLDREWDRYHPLKKNRPSATGKIKGLYVHAEYVLFAGTGLILAKWLSPQFLLLSLILLFMGLVYNVPPIRTKDRTYLDVISESVNNPLRLLLGWSVISSNTLPPSSILLAYWTGGAFLMAIKRFAEYRFIGDPERAGLYRRSFVFYTEEKLLISSFFYALCSTFFLGIFLIKYRIEFVISFPFFALLFAWYLMIGFRAESALQTPEKLYREKKFVAYVFLLISIVTVLFIVDIPQISLLLDKLEY